jgi:hypothetical protein
MEAAAFFAGEAFTDYPQCVCPTLARIGRVWNDHLPNAERQALKQYIPLLIGTHGGAALADARAWAYIDWVLRTMLPMWLQTEAHQQRSTLSKTITQSRISRLTGNTDQTASLNCAVALDQDLPIDREIQASKHKLFARLISMQATA